MADNDLEIDVSVPPEVDDEDLGEHLITLGKSLLDPNDDREGQKIWSRNPVKALAQIEDEISTLVDFRAGHDQIVKVIGG